MGTLAVGGCSAVDSTHHKVGIRGLLTVFLSLQGARLDIVCLVFGSRPLPAYCMRSLPVLVSAYPAWRSAFIQ